MIRIRPLTSGGRHPAAVLLTVALCAAPGVLTSSAAYADAVPTPTAPTFQDPSWSDSGDGEDPQCALPPAERTGGSACLESIAEQTVTAQLNETAGSSASAETPTGEATAAAFARAFTASANQEGVDRDITVSEQPVEPVETPLSSKAGDQCELQLSEREGAGFCLGSITPERAATITRKAQSDLGESAISNSEVRAAAANNHCQIGGCWDMINSSTVTFKGVGSYWYGSRALGDIEFYFKVTSNGKKLTSYPFWFSASRGVRDVVFSNESLYMSTKYPGGNSQNPRKYKTKKFARVNAGVSAQWPKPGPSSLNTIAWATIVGEVTWKDASTAYPGEWHFYAKSIEMQKQGNGSYRANADDALPKTPVGSGYRR